MVKHETTSGEPEQNRYLQAAELGRSFLRGYRGEHEKSRSAELLEAIYDMAINRCDGHAAPNDDFLEFTPVEILESVKAHSIDPTHAGKKVHRWWKGGAPQDDLRAGLIDGARQAGSRFIPWVEKAEGGGPGRTSIYHLTIKELSDADRASTTDALPDGWVRYHRESERRPTFAPLVGVPLGGTRSKITLCLAIPLMLATIFFGWLSLAHLQQGDLKAVLQSLTSSAVFGGLLYILMGHLARTRQMGIVIAGVLTAPWNEHEPTQLVFEGGPDGNSVQLTKFYTACQVRGCGGRVTVRNGAGSMRGRLVGCCERSPREHIYTFDHATEMGIPLRTAALLRSGSNN